MTNCGCKGYYHNGGCSDVNVVFWLDADGKLPKSGIPVNPTAEELSAQQAIVKQRLRLPESAEIVTTFTFSKQSVRNAADQGFRTFEEPET